MIIKIKIEPEKDNERTMNYFYEQCLNLYSIGEIDSFSVEIEGTKFKRERK